MSFTIKFIRCESAEEHFGNNPVPCNNGDASVEWLRTPKVNTGNRAYQREKVASLIWKQGILHTILINVFAGIPEIHIRVIRTENGYKYELIDGQQRVTAILDFLDGKYSLPANMVVDGCDIGGMNVGMLESSYPEIYQRITEYRISCKWYENLTDQQTAHLFIKVLNNVNGMNGQEIRNAVLGFYSDYVRNTARFDPHELFTRIIEKKGKKEVEALKYFSPKFTLAGRMEVDEWLSKLVYLWKNGVTKGVSKDKHFAWVEKTQIDAGEYVDGFKDEKEINKLLNFALILLKATPKQYKVNLKPMVSLMLVLYANDLKTRFGKIDESAYVRTFFKVYDDWSCTDKELYNTMTTDSGAPMRQFKDLFGGENSNAINTILKVLEHELKKQGKKAFGIIEIDSRPTFKRADIIKKWKEQGYKCYYSGVILTEEDIAGDHLIPRSAGIDAGGVTEYKNLVVCKQSLNNKKSNLDPDIFKQMITKVKADAKEAA